VSAAVAGVTAPLPAVTVIVVVPEVRAVIKPDVEIEATTGLLDA